MASALTFNSSGYPLDEPKLVTSEEEVHGFLQGIKVTYSPEPDECILLIVRHGQNHSNAARVFGGRTNDTPLTDLGVGQALDTGEKLREKVSRIDLVVTSPMRRTIQTASHIIDRFGNVDSTPIQTSESLHERDAGSYENKPLELYEKEVNNVEKLFSASTDHSFTEKMQYVPSTQTDEMPLKTVESYASVWSRFSGNFSENHKKLQGKVALTVVDSGVFRTAYWHLCYKLGFFTPYDNFKPDNGAYMIVSINKNGEMSLCESYKVRTAATKVTTLVIDK